MAQFRHDTTRPSPGASRLLHPAAEAEPALPPADVLPDIAAGLARTIPAAAAHDADHDAGGTLLATAAYEASLEVIGADSCRVIDSPPGLAASLAVVTGQLLVWTADDGSEVLSAGGLCSIAGGERVQLVNIGIQPVVLVLVRARRGADHGVDPAGSIARFAPCTPAVAG
ncbi:MAG: cupin domain-containing protein [Acidimicrobiales bacterium]